MKKQRKKSNYLDLFKKSSSPKRSTAASSEGQPSVTPGAMQPRDRRPINSFMFDTESINSGVFYSPMPDSVTPNTFAAAGPSAFVYPAPNLLNPSLAELGGSSYLSMAPSPAPSRRTLLENDVDSLPSSSDYMEMVGGGSTNPSNFGANYAMVVSEDLPTPTNLPTPTPTNSINSSELLENTLQFSEPVENAGLNYALIVTAPSLEQLPTSNEKKLNCPQNEASSSLDELFEETLHSSGNSPSLDELPSLPDVHRECDNDKRTLEGREGFVMTI